MMIEVLKSKLHCVTVTEANLNYMGSITIDEDLMDAANMIAGEKVQIVDNNNGERFETYIIKGERGSGCICLNGAAARKGERQRSAPLTAAIFGPARTSVGSSGMACIPPVCPVTLRLHLLSSQPLMGRTGAVFHGRRRRSASPALGGNTGRSRSRGISLRPPARPAGRRPPR